ncbi:hypothetical protein DID78_02725, partial [Candidatus Marinamargulisbacteria bacterium SCGC AG-343-D04]
FSTIVFLFNSTLFPDSSHSSLGQHFIIGIDHYPIEKEWLELIHDYDVSGVIFISSTFSKASTVKKAVSDIKKVIHNPYFFFSIDQEGGRVNRIKEEIITLPSPKSIHDSKDLLSARNWSFINASQLNECGINVNFSPVVDVNRNSKNKVIGSRSFSANPFDVITQSSIVVEEHLKNKVLPVLKHFPGHGQTQHDSHSKLPVHSRPDELELFDIKPFYSLIKKEAPAVMVGHVLYPSLDPLYPASLSKEIVSNILIQDMGFEGLIFSDDLSMGAVKNSYSLTDSSLLAMQAGIHQLIVISNLKQLQLLFKSLELKQSQDPTFNLFLENRLDHIRHAKRSVFHHLL